MIMLKLYAPTLIIWGMRHKARTGAAVYNTGLQLYAWGSTCLRGRRKAKLLNILKQRLTCPVGQSGPDEA